MHSQSIAISIGREAAHANRPAADGAVGREVRYRFGVIETREKGSAIPISYRFFEAPGFAGGRSSS